MRTLAWARRAVFPLLVVLATMAGAVPPAGSAPTAPTATAAPAERAAAGRPVRPAPRAEEPTSATSSTATADPTDAAALPHPATPGGLEPGPGSHAGPVTGPDGPDGGDTAASLEPGAVRWVPCRDGDVAPDALAPAECARIAVPLDHATPDGATISLALLRWPAEDRSRRIGTLFVNPGGPGGSGVALARNAPALLDPEVRARYDVVGFDPRGVGASQGLSCGVDDDLLAAVPTGADPLGAQLAYGTRLADACEREQPGLLATLDTVTVARDLELLREALGDPALNYLGYSYGSTLGATYATLHPGRVGRMVLDGAAAPDAAYLDWVAAQLASFERSLERFLSGCDHQPRCPLAGRATTTWASLLDRAGSEGLAVRGGADLDRAELLGATTALLYLGTDYHELLAGLLLNAATGDAAGLAEFARRSSGLSAAAYYGVVCGDERTRPTTEELAARIAVLSRTAPTFAGHLREVRTCDALPSDGPPAGPSSLGATTDTPVLLVATRHDPATPYAGTLALQRALPGSALLTYDADGHTIVGRGSRCVDRAVAAYLLDATLPELGATCRPMHPLGIVLDAPGAVGAAVSALAVDSPAQGRLAPGDVVRSVNGLPLTRPDQLDELAGLGAPLRIEIDRAGRSMTVTVDVGPAPYWQP